MNLSKFNILGEDNDNYHIGHPNGKKMIISKSGLSKSAHELVKKLRGAAQNFAEGGEILASSMPAPDSAEQIMMDAGAGIAPVEQPAPMMQPNPINQASMYSAQGPEQVQVQQPQQPAIPAVGAPGHVPGTENALMASQQANQAMANSAIGQGKAESQAIKDVQSKIAELPSQQKLIEQNKVKDDELMRAYQEKKIDPDRYWNNKSLPAKISAGLGMILSGFGGGVSGGGNLAAENIQKMIQADIESQKEDKSNALNLWKMNREALGTDLAANLATQNQMYTGLQYKLMDAASQFKGPQAQAQAQAANALLNQKIAENRFKLSLLNGPTQENQDPAQLVNWLVDDPSERKVVSEEIKRAQDTKRISHSILEDFDKAAVDLRPFSGGRLKNIIPGTESAYAGALEQHLMTTLQDLEGSVKESAAESLKHTMMPRTGNSDKEIQIKRQALVDYLASKQSAPNAKRHGIDLEKYPSSQAAQQAPEIQMMNGVKYQKVPGGWKRL